PDGEGKSRWPAALAPPALPGNFAGSTDTRPPDSEGPHMRSTPPIRLLAVLVAATPVIPVAAQETPTEKTAAADVIRRMSDLERSLAVPQLVTRLVGARDTRRDAEIARTKALQDTELLDMAAETTRTPDDGWTEERWRNGPH